MSVFKCKMCGGTIEFELGATVGTCDSCGTKQTLPKLDDEKRANLYDRANHFRRNNDFDKAAGIYETILNEDKSDAEAYWSLVLCKYGIEYVEDPATHKRVPTVNRTQFASVLADEDYKSALEYASIEQKIIYEKEAKAIDEIQKGILEISNKEEPFDVFICYKETDNNGRRTPDSVLANDLYHQLTQEGFKVFFSRITLEDKLGQEYEPYIFAALNSAKVMVVLGTKPEYFNAVWVKNEWSRYLALIKKGAKKVLIPAYKDMDPYDLPEEFSHLQAQDMSKLGFMQDLIRGIKKLANAEKPKCVVKETVVKETVVQNNSAVSSSVSSKIERIFLFLESGDWTKANEYCEKVLDLEPKNAKAYLGKLMSWLKIKTKEELKNCTEPFDNNPNCVFACRFDAEIGKQLEADNQYIRERNETARKQAVYDNAFEVMKKAYTDVEFKKAATIFATINGFKDAGELAEKCLKEEENAKKETVYNNAAKKMKFAKTADDFNGAAEIFAKIKGFKDSDKLCEKCLNEAENMKKEAKYTAALDRMTTAETESEFNEAARIFEAIQGYKDSDELAETCRESAKKVPLYNNAKEKMTAAKNESDYLEATKLFESIQGFKDSDKLTGECLSSAKKCREAALAAAAKRRRNKIIGLTGLVILIVFAAAMGIRYYIEQERIKAEEAKFSHLEWSEKASNTMWWNDAVEYCKNLDEGGYTDWRLPTISELRSLIRNCSNTQIGGKCRVTDTCLSWDDCRDSACNGCSYDESGRYSRFGDTGWFWSSSTFSDNTDHAWGVSFEDAHVGSDVKSYSSYVRCVR